MTGVPGDGHGILVHGSGPHALTDDFIQQRL